MSGYVGNRYTIFYNMPVRDSLGTPMSLDSVVLSDRQSGICMALDMGELRKFLIDAFIPATQFKKTADEILKQVVCDCGNFRHHGVDWMPEGSGEGLAQAIDLLKKLVSGQ